MVTADFRSDESFPVKTGYPIHRDRGGFLRFKHFKKYRNDPNKSVLITQNIKKCKKYLYVTSRAGLLNRKKSVLPLPYQLPLQKNSKLPLPYPALR